MIVLLITLGVMVLFVTSVAIALGRYIEWRETQIISGDKLREMREKGLL